MVAAFIFMQMVHGCTYPLDPQCLECWLHSMSGVKNWKSNNFLQLNSEKTQVLVTESRYMAEQILSSAGGFFSNIMPVAKNPGV